MKYMRIQHGGALWVDHGILRWTL